MALRTQRQAWLEQAARLLTDVCVVPCPLPDTPQMAHKIGHALSELSKAAEQEFTYGWDALRKAIERPGGCDPYANVVVNFLIHTEVLRLRYLQRIAENPHTQLSEAQEAHRHALNLAGDLAELNNRALADRVIAALAEKRRALGDTPLQDSHVVAHAPPIAASAAPVAAPSTLNAVYIPGYRANVKGDRAVMPQVAQGVKAKYYDAASSDDSKANVAFRRLRARDGASNVYTVSETIECGAFGKFRLAVDQNDQPWAIKEYRVEQKANGKSRLTGVSAPADVIEEITLLGEAKANQGAHDVFAVNEKVYVVMPLMHGDLQQALDTFAAHTEFPTIMRSMFYHVADTLKDLHAKNIMHRDIKPENVLWNEKNEWQLIDFGMAQRGAICDVADVRGTLGYLAPEMLTGTPYVDNYDTAVDIFSLGLLLAYSHSDNENLCPFATVTSVETMARAVDKFETWRKRRLKDNGTLNWHLIRRRFEPLDAFAKQFHEIDASLCEYVFEHMLRVNPRDRDTTSQVLRRAKAMHDAQKPYYPTTAQFMESVAWGDEARTKKLKELRTRNAEAIRAEHAWQAAHSVPTPPPTPPHIAAEAQTLQHGGPDLGNAGAAPTALRLAKRHTIASALGDQRTAEHATAPARRSTT